MITRSFWREEHCSATPKTPVRSSVEITAMEFAGILEGIPAALGPARTPPSNLPSRVPASATVRAVEIPDWFGWIFLGLTLLQALGLVPIIRRLRGLDSAVRAEARFDLLETIGSMLLFGGLLLSLEVSESWFRLALAGFVLMGAGYAVKGVRLLRARRRPTA